VFLVDGVAGVLGTVLSKSIDLIGNDVGGAVGRRVSPGTFVFAADATYVVPEMLVLLWLGTTVVAPLATLVEETIEDALGLVAPDDVPAVVECDVLRVVRDVVSDGGLEVIRVYQR
jgi:hypothetical protein